ncbi:MAG: rod shape-determining protein MreC [Alphaproteobacteria bacterium]|nr:rod shape-determining protein MreC [Alphaproteobacteria bacterium]
MKRQRILFIKENYVLRIFKNFMMAGLFAIALLLILVHKIDLGVISGVSKGVLFITAPLIRTAGLPAEGLSYAYKKASEITNVYQENERLRKENNELFLLKDQMRAVQAENAILKKLLHHFDTPNAQTYTARVIAETGSAVANSLILYIGKNEGKITPGNAVVSSKGLIGRIDLISGKYARVTLITDINSKIPVVVKKSRDRGILIGTNTQELKLIFTPLLAELHKGDILVTSGIGGGLPPDIPVAVIKKATTDTITAVPLYSPKELEIVKIIAYDITPDKQTAEELE